MKDQAARICIEYEWLTQTQLFKKYQQTPMPIASSYLGLASARLTLFRLSEYSKEVRKKIRQRRRENQQIQYLRERHKCCGRSKYYNEGQVYLFNELPLTFEVSFNAYNRTRPQITIGDPTGLVDTIANCNCIVAMTAPTLISSLMQLAEVFRGKSITSNLIESVFGQLDLAIPRSGNHSYESYDAVFSSWFAMVDQTMVLIEASQDSIGDLMKNVLNATNFDDEIYQLFSRSSVYSLNNLESGIKIMYWK